MADTEIIELKLTCFIRGATRLFSTAYFLTQYCYLLNFLRILETVQGMRTRRKPRRGRGGEGAGT